MFKALSHVFVMVTDQDEALDFYVGKLGFELHTDADMGDWRWLTVTLPGQEQEIVLMVPGPPAYDPDTEAQIRAALSKGGLSFGILATDDCRATYEALRAKGVEFTEEPTERFYGIDCALRDPFGNALRITQPVEGPVEVPSKA
jgi:catechol 2,3-dioxygenase-like lactoylglutathione lyase family enzyme